MSNLLPPVWERAANSKYGPCFSFLNLISALEGTLSDLFLSSVILLFIKICLATFPFDVLDKL